MAIELIECPECGHKFPISEAIKKELREELKGENESALASERARLDADRAKVAERGRSLEEREKLLIIETESHNKLVEEQVSREVEKRREKDRTETEDKFETKIADLNQQIEHKDRKLDEFKNRELELLKLKQEAEEAKKDAELEVARRMDTERPNIERAVSEKLEGQYGLQMREKEKQVADLKTSVADLQRQLEQGPQQRQGEVLELALEEFLRRSFPRDTVEPVPKGVAGADVLQKVLSDSGQNCGTIIWESKRTKNWSDSWVAKLKDDQMSINAQVAVILSTALPKGVSNFEMREGVWITSQSSLPALATALRYALIQVTTTRLASVGKSEKMELLYNYLTGQEFRRRIETIVETFESMRAQLDQEKRALTKAWKIREKQIERVVVNTSSLYGEIQSIAGSSLLEIASLELPQLPDSDEEADQDEGELPF